ncbi:hypothetical protein CNQ34_09335 [Neisseria meningitidis]|uniref:Pilus assembly protein PilS n=1 Tax=Neisseria meningitidis TaxID=487 RepID=A0AB36RSN3_NEIME|nr:hypothetical protein CQR35_02765 [Neisseria meningitidis]ATL36433.1 hypothetical protein CQR34_06000 [Neisseria meningitidis]AUX06311.1 hypothetical protein BVD88_07925 [Neisseria meningitidis]PBJ88021.1 hypothetical protein CNQ34_09335 [Neisseria meningitidis]RNJ92206.1 hypothetical protein COI32_10715 [Neisseria meningitidis]
MGAETYTPSFPRTRESSNRKTTGIYRKNRNPRPSFPRTRESSNRKTTGIYRKKQKPPTVIPANAGI